MSDDNERADLALRAIDKIESAKISKKSAAQEIDVSEATLKKFVDKGEASDETLTKVKAWLGVTDGSTPDVESEEPADFVEAASGLDPSGLDPKADLPTPKIVKAEDAPTRDTPSAPVERTIGRPVTVEVLEPEEISEERKYYWTGIIDENFPLAVVHVGGVEFPKTTEEVIPGIPGEETRRVQVKGVVVYLTQAQVDLILKQITNKVCRTVAGASGIKQADEKRYMPRQGDKPLAYALYMIQIDDPTDWLRIDPVPMAVPAKPKVSA